MKKKSYLLLSLLILGLIFSATFGFKFSLHDGFSISEYWIKLPFQILDVAVISSNELYLTSQLIGYIFYLIAGILIFKNVTFNDQIIKISTTVFFLLIGIVFISDFYSYYQDINDNFTGRHIRIGFTVFLIGLIMLRQFNNDSDKAIMNDKKTGYNTRS